MQPVREDDDERARLQREWEAEDYERELLERHDDYAPAPPVDAAEFLGSRRRS